MKTLKSQVNKIYSIIDDLQSIKCDLEEKKDAIENKADENDREMTDRETERYYEIETKIFNIDECINYLEYSLSEIEEYV